MFFKEKEMLKTREPSNESCVMVCTKKDNEIRWRNTILARKRSCFTIASLLKDMIMQLHEVNNNTTPNIGFFVRLLMGHNFLDSDKIFPMYQKNV